jgi:hypothetical protein
LNLCRSQLQYCNQSIAWTHKRSQEAGSSNSNSQPRSCAAITKHTFRLTEVRGSIFTIVWDAATTTYTTPPEVKRNTPIQRKPFQQLTIKQAWPNHLLRLSSLAKVDEASGKWKAAFNSGDTTGCAAQYEATAVIVAKPFGTFTGTAEIQGFWQKLIDDRFSDVDYVAPTKVEPVDDKSAILSSNWSMNKAKGVITKELLWVVQEDGTAKLKEDHFETLA